MTLHPFRNIPAVHVLLAHEAVRALQPECATTSVTSAIRDELDALREQLTHDPSMPWTVDAIAHAVVRRVRQGCGPLLREVINATGIVLHTNLGRAPMPEVAAQAAAQAARGYLNLELDLQTGKRSSRQQPIRTLLAELLNCEAATAVNNCAAATVLTLRALAAGKEVIVSRGQLVEIGGSFRIPEIMAVSGAILREVGTTNITRIADYERALTPQTGLLLRVHQSNYRIRGFTEAASLAELVALGKQHHIPVIDDVGSGALIDYARLGLPGDPVVPQSLATGADLVLFSGDKLLGGPQAGLIAGKKALIQQIERDPLMRAFRLDKMTLAALEATLRLYQRPEHLFQEVPLLRLLSVTVEELRQRAAALLPRVASLAAQVRIIEAPTFVGGGSLPDLPLPSVALAVQPTAMRTTTLAEQLRMRTPAIMTRLQDDAVLFDLRTVFSAQDEAIVAALHALLSTGATS
jgi:L-seryl-tRNA(Ser) seleniumtransferase